MKEEGEGIVLDVKKYSNTSLIVKIFSKDYGKISGFIKGGSSSKIQISVASLISFKISKRLEEHLGFLRFEIIKSFGLLNFKDRFKTFIINSLRETIFFLTEDGAIEEEIYELSLNLLEFINDEKDELQILHQYALFELELLSFLGFGLDFEKCAISGKNENLFFISPLTGRCCGFEEGKEFREKLFEIPFIFGNLNGNQNSKEDLQNAFKINTHFFSKLPKFEKIISREMFLKRLVH